MLFAILFFISFILTRSFTFVLFVDFIIVWGPETFGFRLSLNEAAILA